MGRMFEGHRLLPDATYGKGEGEKKRRILHYGKTYFRTDVFVNVIMREYLLCEIVQREQLLNNKIRVLKKLGADGDQYKAAEYNEELMGMMRQYSAAEYELYCAETMFPMGPIKKSYDTLRQETTWYLRKELVEDCIKNAGCCSRSCGCCQTRHERTVRSRGIGHCTPSCECCSIERGFEYTAEDRQGFADDLQNRLYDDNPACLIQMAEDFFLLPPLGPRTKEQPSEQKGSEKKKLRWKWNPLL